MLDLGGREVISKVKDDDAALRADARRITAKRFQ
jgi:hypothetical protein